MNGNGYLKNGAILAIMVSFSLSKFNESGMVTMQYVVLGAGGYIGSYLFERFKHDGFSVIGTSRREPCSDGVIVCDILKDGIDNLVSEMTDDDRTAIICIAECNINYCYENYSDAYRINVMQTKKLIHELSLKGFRVIFFSSDQVFDGRSGNYTEESERQPINKYGMMKSEMEAYLLANEMEACILRLPKVVSTLRKKQNILSEWEDSTEIGNIRCIKGNRMSFVSIEDIYRACCLVAEKGLRGLYNIAGDRAYSRAELAHIFYDKLGVDKVEIIECNIEEFHFKEKRPLDLSMSNAKFKIQTGYIFESMESGIDRYITNLKN